MAVIVGAAPQSAEPAMNIVKAYKVQLANAVT